MDKVQKDVNTKLRKTAQLPVISAGSEQEVMGQLKIWIKK